MSTERANPVNLMQREPASDGVVTDLATSSQPCCVVSHFTSTAIEQKLDRLYEFDQEDLNTATNEWSVEDNQVMSLWRKSATMDDNHV